MGLILESVTAELLLLILTLLLYIYIDFKISFTYWKKKNVPHIPPKFPLGNINYLVHDQLSNSLTNIYKELKSQGARYAGMYLLKVKVFVPIDPELIRWMLVQEFDSFSDRGLHINEEHDAISGTFAFLEREKWHFFRTSFNPSFTISKVKCMIPTILENAKNILPLLEKACDENQPIDIHNIARRFTLDVIGSTLFGLDCNCLKNPQSDYQKYTKAILDTNIVDVLRGMTAILFPKPFQFFGLSVLNKKATSFFRKVFLSTVNYRKEHNTKQDDFMNILVRLKNKEIVDGSSDASARRIVDSLKVDMLVAQMFIFFTAGYDTSANTISFCLYELSVNPDIQEKLRREISKTLQNHNGELSYEALMEMSYLDKVVHETLRKYPPLVMLNRRCAKSCKIPESDVVLEENTLVVIPLYAIQHDPEYFPDPDVFDPERFSKEEINKRHKFSFLPFGAGPRVCIASKMGMLQTKIAILSFIKNYKVKLNCKTVSPPNIISKAILIRPKDKILLDVEKL